MPFLDVIIPTRNSVAMHQWALKPLAGNLRPECIIDVDREDLAKKVRWNAAGIINPNTVGR